MKARNTLTGLACALALALVGGTYAQSDEARANAHRVMVRSGMAVALRGFTAQVENGIKHSTANLQAELLPPLRRAVLEAFRPDRLREDITTLVAQKLILEDMQAAVRWLETEAGRRITLAEEVGSAVQDQGHFAAYVEALRTRPLSAERSSLIADIISAAGAVQTGAATQEAIALGIGMGVDALRPEDKRLGEAVIRGRLRQAMPPQRLRSGLAQQLPVLFAYIYRDVSDADLRSYAAFLNSSAGKRYQYGMNAAFMEGLAQASLRVGELARQKQSGM